MYVTERKWSVCKKCGKPSDVAEKKKGKAIDWCISCFADMMAPNWIIKV